MKYYFIIRDNGDDLIGQFTIEEIRNRHLAGEFRGEFLATEAKGCSFRELMRRGGVKWVRVDELLLSQTSPEPATEPPSSSAAPSSSSSEVQRVTVVDVDMKFGTMVVFMIKWAFAAIPAAIIIFLIVSVIMLIVGGSGLLISH
jgi:hypothetical protein